MREITFYFLLFLPSIAYTVDEAGFNIPGGKFYVTDETQLNRLITNVTQHLSTLSAQPNNPQFRFIRHYSAIYRVITGFEYELATEIEENGIRSNCTITLWEKPWIDFIKFTVKCGNDENRKYQWIKGIERRKRSLLENSLVGGFSDIPSSELSQLHLKLTDAFTQLSAQRDDFNLAVRRIINAKRQIIAGIRYIVTIEVKTSKNEIKECTADVWEKPWKNYLQVDLTCEEITYQIVKQ